MGGDFRRLSACRLCGSGDLREYIDFGEVALGNNLQPTAELAIKAASYPLTVFRCAACGHFQTRPRRRPEPALCDKLYISHRYRAELHPTFRSVFRLGGSDLRSDAGRAGFGCRLQ